SGTLSGGSILILGSHSPGGRTVTCSKNSSMPATMSSRRPTSSTNMVERHRPHSWASSRRLAGCSRKNTNLYLVGRLTSDKSPRMRASLSLTRPQRVVFRSSTPATITLATSLPLGIFLRKRSFACLDR
ncbi:hypothetical protein EGW08_012003, partial [Elysia chlorotica]